MIAVTAYYLNIIKCLENGTSFVSISNFIFVFNFEREKIPYTEFFTSNFDIDLAGL